MHFPVKELEERIVAAKRFLNQEMTHIRNEDGVNSFNVQQIAYHMDHIHNVERIGLRNIEELDYIRIKRVLTSVEAQMGLNLN